MRRISRAQLLRSWASALDAADAAADVAFQVKALDADSMRSKSVACAQNAIGSGDSNASLHAGFRKNH
jgi:hypothetical protein